MSQRSGFRGGYRGRGRPSPYSWKDRPRQWQKDQGRSEGEREHEREHEEIEENHSATATTADVVAGGDGRVPGATPEGRREKKLSNKARLFVGNLPRDFSSDELKKLFEEYGEVQEVFLQREKNYGFVRMVRKPERGCGCAEKGLFN